MKKLLLITALFIIQFSLFNFTSKAQIYVTIPDANFAAWLQTHYPNCMSGNQMDMTCADILNATSVDVSNSSIADLTGIENFVNINYLNCSNNLLTFLPDLPTNISNFNCSINQLTSLPTLPTGIVQFHCNNNQLTSLPALPSTLEDLDCKFNFITALPTLSD